MAKNSKSRAQRPALSIVGADAGGEPPTADTSAKNGFTIYIRGISQRSDEAIEVGGTTVAESVLTALKYDVGAIPEPILYWVGNSKVVALDFDRELGQPAVRDEDIVGFFPEWVPQPLAAWATHDGGLRAIFVEVEGHPALALAGVWYQGAPLGELASWPVEVKTESRHPNGPRGTETCGQVFSFAPSANFLFPSQRGLYDVNSVHIQAWLDPRGLTFGRHGFEACPWCGDRPGTCNPCFVIDEHGVRCYRCQKSASWVALLDDRPGISELYTAARNLVHFPHQKFVLKAGRPATPDELLQAAWEFMLYRANQNRLLIDPEGSWLHRIDLAASGRIDIVRSASGVWLSEATLEPRRVSADRTLKELPWAMTRTRIDQALSAEPLPGFMPIETIGHSYVVAPGRDSCLSIQIRRPPQAGEPPLVALGSKPPDSAEVENAWCALQSALPGLNRGYLTAIVIGALWAQRGVSTPPIICATGTPGTSKTATTRVGAGMVGTKVGDIMLTEPRDVLRQIGLHLESGRSPIFLDEIGRVRGVYEKLLPILGSNSVISFEPKYANERMTTFRAPIVIAGSTLPRAIVTSPELARRSVGFLLTSKAPGWDTLGEAANLRNNPGLRPHLDTITACIWWLLSAEGPMFNFRQYCFDNLGAVPLSDLDSDGMSPDGRDEAVRQLYAAFTNARPSQITQGNSWKGWLECTPGTPNGQLLEDLVDFDGDPRAQHGETEDLKRLDLPGILGFETPRLRLLVRRRSAKWLVKFEEQGVPRGRGCKREDLPPLQHTPNPADVRTPNQEASSSASCASSATATPNDHDSVASEETEI